MQLSIIKKLVGKQCESLGQDDCFDQIDEAMDIVRKQSQLSTMEVLDLFPPDNSRQLG